MKKIKLFLGFIILVFAGLIIYQNREYFFAMQALSLNLGVATWHWTAPPIQNIAYNGIFLVLGILMAGYYGLSSKFRSNRTIKALNSTIDSHLEKIAILKKDLEKFRNDPYNRQGVIEMEKDLDPKLDEDGNGKKEKDGVIVIEKEDQA
jgi:hypothetical protein